MGAHSNLRFNLNRFRQRLNHDAGDIIFLPPRPEAKHITLQSHSEKILREAISRLSSS